jgi:uncharacterized damage-inducible protein DinB
MTSDSTLMDYLIQLLRGGHAHATFDDIVREFPAERAGIRPPGAPHSAWELLEHMRIAQRDILEFSRSGEHVSPKWPEGYWPKSPAPGQGEWNNSVRAFREDLAAFEAMIRDASQDLHREFPWGDGQTLFREALLIADHNSYHLGQLVLVRQLLGDWKG